MTGVTVETLVMNINFGCYLEVGCFSAAEEREVASEATGALRETIVAVNALARHVVQFSSQYDVQACGTLEVFLVEALLKLFNKDTLAIDINESMAKATARHFSGHASH